MLILLSNIVSGCMGTIESRPIIPHSLTPHSQRTTPHHSGVTGIDIIGSFIPSREDLAPSPIGPGSVVNNPAFIPTLILARIERRTNREEVKGGFLSGCVQECSFVFFACGLVSRCPRAYSSSVSPSRKSSDSGIALNTGQKPSGVTLKPNKADNWFQQRWPR